MIGIKYKKYNGKNLGKENFLSDKEYFDFRYF